MNEGSAAEVMGESEASHLEEYLHEYLEIREQRKWIFPRAALVGAGAGLGALFLRTLLTGGDMLRNALLTWAHDHAAFGWAIVGVFPVLGAGLAVAITRRWAPEASGSGIPQVEAALHHFRDLQWKRVLLGKLVGGTLAIGSGLALGREGPTVHIGGAIGDAIARWLKIPGRQRRIFIAAGAGAGLAAAFNTPLAGVVFVLEELQGDFQPAIFGAAFLAAVVADVLTRIGFGQSPIFSIPSYPVAPLESLPVFAFLGLVAALVGVLFNRTLLATVKASHRWLAHHAVLAAAGAGAVVGLVGWFFPAVLSSGYGLVEAALRGDLVLASIPLLFLLRFGLTIISYGTGAPGGIFLPLLVLGSLLGLAIGEVTHQALPGVAPEPGTFALVGMAALFAAIVRAPLTGIVLIVEMTGSYSEILPLLVSCFTAYMLAEFLRDTPVYEALLEYDLKRQGEGHRLSKPMVVEFTVEPGS
ncbi:MAG: H(+)/Cl(-) exchange transporter ClcA, partial [Thermomicrobium sp.]